MVEMLSLLMIVQTKACCMLSVGDSSVSQHIFCILGVKVWCWHFETMKVFRNHIDCPAFLLYRGLADVQAWARPLPLPQH